VRGGDVDLELRAHGARQDDVRLVLLREGQQPTVKDMTLTRPSDGVPRTSCKLTDVEETFRFRFEYGKQRSRTCTVNVADLPRIEAINYELIYPGYTGQPPRTVVGRVPQITALEGTRVLVSFKASTPLSPTRCWVDWEREEMPQPITINGRYGHFPFEIEQADAATLHLCGSLGKGFEMKDPPTLDIMVEKDKAPWVEILLKKKDLALLPQEGEAFGFRCLAGDDFGVSRITLTYRVQDTLHQSPETRRPLREGKKERKIRPPRDRAKEVFKGVFGEFEPALAPGDQITFSLAVEDNRVPKGATGRSEQVRIRIVSEGLGEFVEKEFGFGRRHLLGELHKIKRETNLLVQPEKSIRTEKKIERDKKALTTHVSKESWPSGAEDAVGDYFRLLSGEE
jgi:hypothetical protein